MKLVAFTLALALASTHCAGVNKVLWPVTVKCALPITSVLVQQIEAILNQGSGTTIGADAIAALEKLAADHGPELVACIVEQFISNVVQPNGQLPTARASDAAARAQDFLNRKGVFVVEGAAR